MLLVLHLVHTFISHTIALDIVEMRVIGNIAM